MLKADSLRRYEVELEAEGWWADFGRLMTPGEQDHRASTFMDLGVSRSTVVESEVPSGVETTVPTALA
jgi:hypothetical protein